MEPFSTLVEAVRSDYRRHGRDWTLPGFRAMAVYRLGAWRRTATSRLVRVPLYVVYRTLHRFIRNHYGIEIHETATIGPRVRIIHQSGIVVHRYAVIGADCIIRQNVTIGAATFDQLHKGPALGDRVDVGAGAAIIGQVTIGEDVHIGPNAVVMRDVPAGTIVSGPPAKAMTIPAGAGSQRERP